MLGLSFRGRRAFACAVVTLALAACLGGEDGEARPPVVAEEVRLADRPQPCSLLDDSEVGDIVGVPVSQEASSGEDVFRLCTYALPDGAGAVNIAIADLAWLATTGEKVSGEEYLAELRRSGAGVVAEVAGVGEGSAITITDERASQAWAWRGQVVVGAQAEAVDDPADVAVRLLRAALQQLP